MFAGISRAYYVGGEGGKLPPISARGEIFSLCGGIVI